MNIKNMMRRVGVVQSIAVMIAICIGCSSEKFVPPEVSMTDSTVTINGMAWTRQNLNIETPDSWCYEDKDSNCAKYGRLYTWEAAKKACQSMGGKWHLPSSEEWDKLVKAAGGEEIAGKKLKSKTGWNDDDGESGNGTDEFGFSALPGGHRGYNGSFYNVGDYGNWWGATEYGGGIADGRGMHSGVVDENVYLKSGGVSVRCAQE